MWSGAICTSALALLIEYHDIFSLEPGELECTSLVKHEIKGFDDKPFEERFQRIPPPMVEEVRAHMRQMLEVGTIHPSQSPWFNAVMLVRKKDRGLHFCIDFCKLNARTKKILIHCPHIQEANESLVGVRYFSCLDLKVGFWQIAMDKASEQFMAFVVENLGFFKCEHMPFGLCNAPASFHRLMQNCLGELNLMYCLIYLDDMIVFSKTEEEHVQHLHVMQKCFCEHNLKFKLNKCKFFCNEINYLAHHVSKEGILPSKENIKAMTEFAWPQTYTEIWAFLGLVGHYQWMIRRFACVVQPVHKHLSGEVASKKSGWVTLTSDAQIAFETLKKACLETPVLVLLTLISHFSWKPMLASQEWGGGSVITKTCWWAIPPCCICQPLPDQPWA